MKNSDLRKYLVGKFYLLKMSQYEIINALSEVDCTNNGKPWTQATISGDIAELESTFKEKTIDELVTIKMRKFAELETIQRLAIEKSDMKNALQAIKQQVELLGLNAPLRSEVTFNNSAQDEILKKLDSYLITND